LRRSSFRLWAATRSSVPCGVVGAPRMASSTSAKPGSVRARSATCSTSGATAVDMTPPYQRTRSIETIETRLGRARRPGAAAGAVSTPTAGALLAAGCLGTLAAAVRTASRLGPLRGLDVCGFGGRSLVGRDLTDQFHNRLRRRGDLLRGNGDSGSAHECRSVPTLFGQHYGDDVAGAAGACGTPGAVQVN